MSSEVPPRRALLVSPPMPCGLDYVDGVLRRLGIGLVSGQRLDLINQPHDAVILVVRHPVDATYAQYRRMDHAARGVAFAEYLDRPVLFPDLQAHRGPIAGPLEHYALFCMFWLLAGVPVHLIRFEDVAAGRAAFAGTLRFLGVYRPADAIGDAVAGVDPVTGQREPAPDREPGDMISVEPLNAIARALGYRSRATREGALPPHDLVDAAAQRLPGPADKRTVTAGEFAAWASALRAEFLARDQRPAGLRDLRWAPEILPQILALETAQRLLANVLVPGRQAPLAVYGRLWLGLAAGLVSGIDNPRLRWLFADALGPVA